MTTSQASVTSNAEAHKHVTLHPWLVMAFIAIPIFVGSLDLTVVSAFLPELIQELGLPFDTGLDDASWIVTGYLLAYTISLTFTGRLSDLYGRRRVYIISLVVFMLGSLLVAIHLIPTEWLYQLYRRMGQRPDIAYVELQVIIVGRVIQALGAGALVPVSLALAADLFPPEKRSRPLGFVGAMDTLGWVLGHVYGALLVQVMPWQGLFWINIPLTLVALALVLYALRNVPVHRVAGRFDVLGTVLIVGALTCLSVGLGANIEIGGLTGGIEDLSPLPPYAGPVLLSGALMFLGFILVERRVRDPLMNVRMFRSRNLSLAALINLLVGYCLFIGLVSVPVLVNLRQESLADLTSAALQVGLLLCTLTVPMAIAAVPGGWLSERIGIRNTVLIGLATAIVGFLLIWQTWSMTLDYVWISLQMTVVGVGIGLTFSPISEAMINSASDDERGVAGALVLILRLVGMTVSVASLSSLMLARVQFLASSAQAGATGFDQAAFLQSYASSAIQVLGEMGLIGAALCGVALLLAAFLGKHASYQGG